ncbi:MAG: 4Fe-4S dicluster domain-containing protein [Deferribacterales bacterium]
MINLQKYRWIVRIINTLLFLSIPFIKINGQSALRFDIPSLRLFVFGTSVWIENFFILLILTFFITFLAILVTQLYGRIWCGWFCPHTAIISLTGFFDKKDRTALTQVINHIIIILVSAVIGVWLVFYFVSPYDFMHDISKGTLSHVTKMFCLALTVITYLNFAFVRYKFCTTICPYSKLQSIMFDKNTLIVAMDPDTRDRCIQCKACVRTCPVDLDIRKGLVSACINCGQCITACAKVMQKKDHPTLIHYIFGFDKKQNPFRVNVLITGAVTLLFLFAFIYMAVNVKPFEFEVFPNQSFMPRTKEGSIINSYEIMLKNTSDEVISVTLSMEGTDKYELQYESPIKVQPDATMKQKVFLFIPEEKLEKMPILSLNMLADAGDGKAVQESELSFRRPIRAKKKDK